MCEVAVKAALRRIRLKTLSAPSWFASLPFHHADLFDRMLVAQALEEQLTLVTHDRNLGAYDVPVAWT